MSQARVRWAIGNARLLLGRLYRDLRGRIATRPPANDVVPRPRVARGARPLRLTHVLVSSDLNLRYLECWPLTADAWRSIADLEPVLVLVAPAADVPEELRRDPRVHVVEPIPGVHTALQAQCIRLLYPALLETGGGGVVTSDVDMVPLNAAYFHRPAGRVDERHFLAYRDILLPSGEIPVCFNAALPRTWGEIFGVSERDDVRARLVEWTAGLAYDGVQGGRGWTTDQLVLHRLLVERGRTHGDVWILDDRYTGYRRLNLELTEPAVRDRGMRRRIARGRYSDFHCLHPRAQYGDVNEDVVRLAAGRRT